MPRLLLKIWFPLEDRLSASKTFGPRFHRWLPDGRTDEISLPTGHPESKLTVWFERTGYTEGDFVHFDYKQREVDPNIIRRQAWLDAGPLRGLMELESITDKQAKCLRQNKLGDDEYIALGKKVIKHLHPPLARFISILRTNYGQYWLPEPLPWDSRRESIGSYFRSLGLTWSLDGGESWTDFIPDEPTLFLKGEFSAKFQHYMTRDDWAELRHTVESDYCPSLAGSILTLAHKFYDQGELKYALVEGITALELSLGELIRNQLHKYADDKSIESILGHFHEERLPFRVITAATFLERPPVDTLKRCLKAIELRNNVVHEGGTPDDEASKPVVLAVLEAAGAFLEGQGPSYRFPSADSANYSVPEEEWGK